MFQQHVSSVQDCFKYERQTVPSPSWHSLLPSSRQVMLRHIPRNTPRLTSHQGNTSNPVSFLGFIKFKQELDLHYEKRCAGLSYPIPQTPGRSSVISSVTFCWSLHNCSKFGLFNKLATSRKRSVFFPTQINLSKTIFNSSFSQSTLK